MGWDEEYMVSVLLIAILTVLLFYSPVVIIIILLHRDIKTALYQIMQINQSINQKIFIVA